MFAEEELQIALLLAVDFLQSSIQPPAEDILTRLTGDEIQPVTTQRKDPLGGRTRRILKRKGRHVEFVGLQPGKLLLRSGVALYAGCSGGRSRSIQTSRRVEQGDPGAGDAPRRLVGQRGSHAEELLRITRIGACQRTVAFDGEIHRQNRPRLRDADSLDGFGGTLQGDVWILCRSAARKQQGQRQKLVFHGLNQFDAVEEQM